MNNVLHFHKKNGQLFASFDLSVGSTETKYIKLKTKPQNDIFILGIFHKQDRRYSDPKARNG